MKGRKPSFPVVLSDLNPGMVVDIRALEQIAVRELCEIIVYFEEDLARNSSYERDLEEYSQFREDERPFIGIGSFLQFQRDMNPLFDEALKQIPLGVTIIRIDPMQEGVRIIGLLPFLDEMDRT